MDSYEDEDSYDMENDEAENKVDAPITVDSHIREKDLSYGLQTKILNMTFTGSLEDIASNSGKAVWKISDNQQDRMKQVTALTNRSKVDKSALEGDLSKAVLVHAQLLQERNDFPVQLGLHIEGLVPKVHTANDVYNWVFEPNTATTMVGQDIFEPDNVFAQQMYESLEKLDTASLKQQIRFDVDPTGKTAMFDPNGYAWKVLARSVKQGVFPGFEDHFYDICDQVRSTGEFGFGARVPTEIAREVYDAIEAKLKNIESSFTDLRKLHSRIERTDGEPWNSHTGLIGEAASLDSDSKGMCKSNAIQSIYTASAKVLIKYFVY